MTGVALAREAGLWSRRTDRLRMVRVTGADARSFLQAALTNDVLGLRPGWGQPSARLDRKGRVQALPTVHDLGPDGVALVTEAGRAQALADDLEQFVFIEEVGFAVPLPSQLEIVGPAVADVVAGLGGPDVEGAAWQVGDTWLFRHRSLGDDALLALGAPPELLSVLEALELGEVAPAAFDAVVEVLRVEAGVPRLDIDHYGKPPLLSETGLAERTVSYTKGCFLGQEVVARTRTYGAAPRALRGLVFPGAALDALDALACGAVVDDGGGRVVICSRVLAPTVGAPLALAWISGDARTPGTRLTLADLAAEVVALPVYQQTGRAALATRAWEQAVERYASGDVEGAIRDLERALRLDPANADAWESLGVLLGKEGQGEAAIGVFHRLGERFPGEPMVHTNLSVLYMKAGDKDRAEEHAALAAASAMDQPAEAVLARADAARRADAEAKRQMFAMVLEIDPDDPIALAGLGRALVVLSEHAEAVPVLERAVAHRDTPGIVYRELARALEALDRTARAQEICDAGIVVASRRGELMPLRELQAQRRRLQQNTGRTS